MVGSEPVLSLEDNIPEADELMANDGISFGSRVKLKAYSVSVDADNLDIMGTLKWKPAVASQSDKRASPLLYVLMLVKEDGGLLWIGDRHSLAVAKGDQSAEISSQLTAVIPRSLKKGVPVCLVLQVIDPATGLLVEPIAAHDELKLSTVPKSLLLKRFLVPGSIISTSQLKHRHFRLVRETAPEMVRIYENTGCVPEAYLVFKTHQVSGIDEAIKEMLRPDFDPGKVALTEGRQVLAGAEQVLDEEIVAGKVSRPNVNQVDVDAQAKKTALLVMTDVFFPGWKATVDGKVSEIYRANGVFRAVKVEPGHHTVSFTYEPPGLKIGFLLFALGLAASVFLLCSSRRANPEKTEQQAA